MMKNVMITVKGVQGIDNEKDTVELTTEGKFGQKDGKYFISYEEGQLMESASAKTNIYINSPKSLVLTRKGDINSRLEIEEDLRKTCFYSTPIGELNMGIYGEKVDINLNENGGSVRLVYTIDSDLKLLSRNEVEITVKEV